jgi:outer membrane protein OmpA-like peptidoglycan-associated protein
VHSKVCFVVTIVGLLAFSAATVHAQSFRLDDFRAAERPDDGFGVKRVNELGHLRWSGLATADYAHDPLVIEGRRGSQRELQTIVSHELVLKLDFTLALWNRALLFAGFDVVPLLKGPTIPGGFPVSPAGGGGFGDVSVGARVRLLGEAQDFFSLAAQATLIAPTSGDAAYRGEGGVAVRPELIAQLRPKYVRINANLGFMVREDQPLLNARVGDELRYAVGVGYPINERLEAMAELWGGHTFKDVRARTATPFEWLLGAKYNTVQGLYAGLGVGTGFTHGIGAPDARVVMQLGYLSRKDKDGDPDRDRDGIADRNDACPDQPEDRDGFEDEDGCPDLDDDHDAIPDSSDSCPREPEDRDGYADEDGCPEPDNDGDGVLDRDDACVVVPGVPEQRGCPAQAVVETESSLHVLEQVHFENNKAVIMPDSEGTLGHVKELLDAHPEITAVRIEGHTDSVGEDDRNFVLSKARAAAVGSWLVKHGIERKRLAAWGCGEKHPVADNSTLEGRAQNRRVMFQLEATTPPGCVEAPIH